MRDFSQCVAVVRSNALPVNLLRDTKMAYALRLPKVDGVESKVEQTQNETPYCI